MIFFRGRALCLLCDEFYRVVAFDVVEHKGGCALLLGLSASRAPRTSGCARFSCPRAASVAWGLLREEWHCGLPCSGCCA